MVRALSRRLQRTSPFSVLVPLVCALGGLGCAADAADAGGALGGDEGPRNVEDFEVGSGDRAFEALERDATIAIIAGPQGGYHIWLSVRCTACGPELLLTYGVEDAESGAPMTSAQGLQAWTVLLDAGSFREASGIVAYLASRDVEAYVGRRARLWARSFTDDGTPLEDEAEATIRGIESWP
ncbi:hypothetical protein [Chondromyces crocatus]|uniref:Lipoprotein n=1 Tax=Chondromyces crocatus TaxID=52 RepID=A0A0K1EI35_CHOCO|nr:hypothetical protein [Chondromyces crocatus]AKT40519.1 uncharacterized protein CMC5_046740 [Chondromyces crocatus]